MTTATETKTASRTDAYGFPVVTCYRCGGTGHYSFNMQDGSRCFGCQGQGVCWKRGKVATAARAFQEARRKARNPIVGNLVKGDMVAANTIERRFNGKGMVWWTVESVVLDTTHVTGWQKNFTTGENEPTAWKCTVTLVREDEEPMVVQAQTNYIITGKSAVDPTPYLVAAGVKKEN